MAQRRREETPPFESPAEMADDTDPPNIGDVWCKREYAGIGNASIGRVDIVDIVTIAGVPLVKFEPRYGKTQQARMSITEFVKHYVPKGRVGRVPEATP